MQTYGPNALPEAKKQTVLQKIVHQLSDVFVIILLFAAGLSYMLNDIKDAVVIFCIVIINIVLALVQESKAENAIAALQQLSTAKTKVIRDGSVVLLDIADVVPGDIIVLEAGDKVPADARVIESARLRVAEAILTGESKPIEKRIDPLEKENLPMGDRINMVYRDTVVVYGRGRAVVTTTGASTEIGKISALLQQQKKTPTPLELELKRIGTILTGIALISAVAIFGILAITHGTSDIAHVLLTAISIAVAVVPEGIPTVVTTVLAVAVMKLSQKNVIVRKLSAVETLGSTTHILTDKTGTLTKNEMTLTTAIINNKQHEVRPNGEWVNEEHIIRPSQTDEAVALLTGVMLCNDGQISAEGAFVGDPTETSLLAAGMNAGLSVPDIRAAYTRIDEIPFSSETKRMTVLVEHVQTKQRYVYEKGAPESIAQRLSGDTKEQLLEQAGRLSDAGIRTLACAVTPTESMTLDGASLGGTWQHLGVVGLTDPLRAEVLPAIAEARVAGIATVMITGDHEKIARSIGTGLGMVSAPEQVLDGSVLGDASVEQIQERLRTGVVVFSRVSPEQKLRIVQAAQANGAIVAVTGDGVNDAPAIKTGDIGVAMGISGTDVTKEVADIVLRDDNYSTIVTAVREGRAIFHNFIKFLRYQISCNLSGVMIVIVPTIAGVGSPLLPIHILLLNLVSETGPSIALGLEKPEKDIMTRPPRDRKERLLTKKRWKQIILEALFLAVPGLLAVGYAVATAPELLFTMTLITAFLSRLWHAFSSRSEISSMFSSSLPVNKSLIYVVFGTLLSFFALIYIPAVSSYLSMVPLSLVQLSVCFGLSFIPVFAVEFLKMRRRSAL
jgi:Ca2+-transporting ATPase